MSLKLTGKLGPITGAIKVNDPWPLLPYYYHTNFDTSADGSGNYTLGNARVENINVGGSSKPTFNTPEGTYENRVRWYDEISGYWTATRLYSVVDGMLMQVIHHNLSSTSFRLEYRNSLNVWTTVNFAFQTSNGLAQEMRCNHLTGKYEFYISEVLFWSTDDGFKGDWDCYANVGEGSSSSPSRTILLPDPN